MKPVTDEQIWAKLMKEEAFTSQAPAAVEATKPFILALPKELGKLLTKKVNLKNVCAAKLVFLRYLLANGFVEKVFPLANMDVTKTTSEQAGNTKVEVTEKSKTVGSSLLDEMMLATMRTSLETLVGMLEELVKDTRGLKKLAGYKTEREAFVDPKIGLTGKALRLYDQKKLTIGDLLSLQPMIIVKNT